MTMADWFHVATAVVTAASAIANVTKTDSDNRIVGWLSQLVHVFALNWTGEAAPKQ